MSHSEMQKIQMFWRVNEQTNTQTNEHRRVGPKRLAELRCPAGKMTRTSPVAKLKLYFITQGLHVSMA